MRKSKNVNSGVSGEPIGAYFRLLFRWPVWYLHTGILYVWFGKEDNPETAAVEAVVTEELIKVIGTPEKMLTNIRIENLTLRHTKRTFMKVKEPLLRSDWCIYRGGALFFENTKDCSIRNCDIVDLGSNAICVNGKNSGFVLQSCLIRDIAGNGVCFIGKNDCVRSPLFEYSQRMDIRELDMEEGPKSENFPSDCQVADCLITRTGRVEKQTAAIQVSLSKGIRITHCSIYEVPRAGVNFSEGNFGGHVIAHCDIFDTVLETGDHGSFNSWGRDRYWELKGVDLNDLKAQNLQKLPYLGAMFVNIIRNNRMRCDWGWDIDLDDGSSNYEIYNNLCLNGGIKLREGFGRKAYNNITVNNSLNVHVWYKDSGDCITHNIVFGKYRTARMCYEWGDRIDYNIVHSSQAKESRPAVILQRDSRKDEHSFVCNCMFQDPESGDYTVQNNKDICVTLPDKTTTAVIGSSGSGKTTFCNLIARFWDTDRGSIKIGGRDVKDYTLESLMNQISVVFQNVYLFADTIENNIKFGCPDATHEQVEAAAKAACCEEFIEELPEGYQTIIGEGGASLSDGEKQRISIARAMLKNAPIVILDEATANVDPENEDRLQKAIEALTRDKTIIMIAHRLKTVRHADKILVIDHGQIVQQGKHEELIAQPGIYADFVGGKKQTSAWTL